MQPDILPTHEATKKSLAQALSPFMPITPCQIHLMETTGLAHKHYRLADLSLLARIPIQSQHGHQSRENLLYQVACFERVSASGQAPCIHHFIDVSDALPMGALIVDEIKGRPPVLPEDLTRIALCLARIHDMPSIPQPPLAYHENPPDKIRHEIEQQAAFLDERSEKYLRDELDWMRNFEPRRPPENHCLVCTDTHPGNFLIEQDRAIIVDLEKSLYGSPSIDLAHSSVYTSTTWDIKTSSKLGVTEIEDFYTTYLRVCNKKETRETIEPWLKPMRRLLILRALTWCAMWHHHYRKNRNFGTGREKSGIPTSLEQHVHERCLHYLQPEIIQLIKDETSQLAL